MSVAIRIGCSGWQYRDWRGRFYDSDPPANRWLEFYTERFDTVELNASFYRLQPAPTYRAWKRRLPQVRHGGQGEPLSDPHQAPRTMISLDGRPQSNQCAKATAGTSPA